MKRADLYSSVRQVFKSDLRFRFYVEGRLRRASMPPSPCPVRTDAKWEPSQLPVSNSGHFAVIPAYTEINLTGLPISRPQVETVVDVGGAMRGMEEVRVSHCFFRLIRGDYFKGATNGSRENPRQNGTLFI